MKFLKNFSLSLLGFSMIGLASPVAQARQVSESQAPYLCTGNFQCGPEVSAPDNRPRPAVYQPKSDSAVQGNCSVLPSGQDYQARLRPLECGGGSDFKLRERYAHTQEDLDRNFELLQIGNREAAQKALLKEQTWTQKIPFSVVENWTYKLKRGEFTDCRSKPGYLEGGQPEEYTTTCFRTGRKEKVVRTVQKWKKVCTKAKPDPEPEVDSPSPIHQQSRGNGGGSSNFGGGGWSAPSGGGGSQRRSDPPPQRQEPKRGRGESEGEIKDRSRRGYNSSIESEKLHSSNRSPAQSLRRIKTRDEEPTYGPKPNNGCETWSSPRENGTYEEELWEDVDDISYSCVKVRNRWCTWLEETPASQACPQRKNAVITVVYKTPQDWNPSNPKYDDQLPNKFDLLHSEREFVKVDLNGGSETRNLSLAISAKFANELKTRTKAWNEYQAQPIPATATCEYKDVAFTLNVHTLGRNVQSAPNPLVIPQENGVEKPFNGVDDKGRPANLTLVNPTRWLVLDRSNLSRAFGESAKDSDKGKTVALATDPALGRAGIKRKFLENTRFWIRLWMVDGNSKVKVTRFREFDINKASPDGENLNISLEGKYGMPAFYKMAVPFEKIFGFLGGDISLDPQAKYKLEIRLAQPSFDGIYLSGLDNDPTLDDEEKKIVSDRAYSEPKYIDLPALTTKRNFMDKFWDWRFRNMRRPFKEKL